MSNKMNKKDRYEYAVTLIETAVAREKRPTQIIYEALAILEFGQITPKEFMSYLDAVGIRP
jgi:hypothetical protein